MHVENNFMPRAKSSFRQMVKGFQENNKLKSAYVPTSITFTKLELPILYSNLVLIEDMKFENSNYFIRSNGFISKKIKISSLTHEPLFDISSCLFRIYPRTYNMNKYKVLDYIQNKASINEEELNFKFSTEMFNNLDIVQSKFGEPIRYGDIIMLMHENTKMFVKFVPSSKTLTLSNHDSDATLFSVEPASEIMLNDDQILKTGQPIKLKIAWFTYANQNLYFGIRFPYSSELADENNNKKDKSNDSDFSDENDDNINDKGIFFDMKSKKYLQEPEIIVEENSTMQWRFIMYSPFTTNEHLIIYGDFVHIYHCNSNSILTIDQNEDDSKNLNETIKISKSFNNNTKNNNNNVCTKTPDYDLNDSNNSFDLNGSDIFLELNRTLSDIDNEEFSIPSNPISKTQFLLRPNNLSIQTLDVNSTWILENIFPLMKHQSFIRYFEDTKIDTYQMVFRIKHFKTNKILSITQVDPGELQSLLKDIDMVNKGYLKGSGINVGKVYKFILLDDKMGNNFTDQEIILSEEYQYSLFGFQKTIKSITYYSNRPTKNDFIRLFHLATQSYLKIIPLSDIIEKKINNGSSNFNDLTKCILTLTKFPEEKEVFKICPVDPYSQWKFKFLNSLYFLMGNIIHHIEDTFTINDEEDNKILSKSNVDDNDDNRIRFSVLKKIRFILDKLLKFTMNKFINKFSSECGFNTVVKNRQTLIANFGFTRIFIFKFIYQYWFHEGNMERINKLNNLLYFLSSSDEAFNGINNFSKEEKEIFAMYKYTEAIFEFLIVYCKDNQEIKNELYEYLYVYFYFINIIHSCLNGMIEIFKNNEKILHSVIRDCKQKEEFKKALITIFKEYFPNYISTREENYIYYTSHETINDSHEEEEEESKKEILDNKTILTNKKNNFENLNLFDLLFEFIKISKYKFTPKYNNVQELYKAQHNCNAISLISREKFFELLKNLVSIYDGEINILENQRCIINKIIYNQIDNDDSYLLKKFLEPSQSDYPPSLKELFFHISYHNPDDNIQKFLFNNDYLQIDRLIDEKNLVHSTQISANMKLIIYLTSLTNKVSRNTDSDDIEKINKFNSKVKEFFRIQKNYFLNKFYFQDQWRINFLNRQQVTFFVSGLQFLNIISENDIVNIKEDKKFLVTLMKFLTRNFRIFQEKKFSLLIHEEMNKKQQILNDRIIKTDPTQYISIAESWLKVYLVFKNILSLLIEEEGTKEIEEKDKKIIDFVSKRTSGSNLIKRKDFLSETKEDNLKDKGEKGNIISNGNSSENDMIETTNQNNILKKKLQKKTTNVMVLFANKDKINFNEFDKDNIDDDMNNTEEFYSSQDLDNDEKNKENENDNKKYPQSFVDSIRKKMSMKNPRNFDNEEKNNAFPRNVTFEDEKTHNKNEISKNILNIFKLIIKKNISKLNENFYDYYNNIEYKKGKEISFDNFIEYCIPNLDSGMNKINYFIRKFCEKEINSKLPCEKELSNLNLEFVEKRSENLNFIQNLFIAFNITDDLEMQETIISLIYNYFHQRKLFFRNVTFFNEHLITLRTIQNNPFNDKFKIKGDFKKFYQNYEKNKHEYSEDDFVAVERFFTLLIQQLLIIFRKILNYWKYEFRTLSLENANKYYSKFEENENLITEIEKLISIIEQLENDIIKKKPDFTKEYFLHLIEILMKIFYFMRKNGENTVFTSLLSVLNESGGIYNKMFYSLMMDFLHKGKRLSNHFVHKTFFFFKKISMFNEKGESKKQDNPENIINIKNKYFICFFLLLSFQYVTLPKNEKNIDFIYSILKNEKDLMVYDSICSYMILLYVSDVEKKKLTLNYFSILENMRIMNQNECFGDCNTKMNLNSEYPDTFSNIYLDILMNVLKFVICKRNMINESNLDEILVETFLFFLKKMDHKIIITKEDINNNINEGLENDKIQVMTKLIKIINYFEEIETLNNIFIVKIDPNKKNNFDSEFYQIFEADNANSQTNKKNTFFGSMGMNSELDEHKVIPIIDYFPKPHQVYHLFESNLENIFEDSSNGSSNINNNELDYVKTTFEIYKYFLFYILEIDPDYLKEMEIVDSFKSEKEGIKNFIQLVLYGYGRIKDANNTEDDGIDYKFIDGSDDKLINLYTKIVFSSLFFLINLTTIWYLDNGNIAIAHIQFREDIIRKNSMKLTNDFFSFDELSSSNTLMSVGSNIGLNTKIMISTGKNDKTNFYIYKKLNIITGEILTLMYQDSSIYDNEEEEENEGEEKIDSKEVLNKNLEILHEKYLYYKNAVMELKNDKLYAFKNMLYNNRKELKKYIRNETTSIIYYLLVLLDSGAKTQYDQIFYSFLNKIVEFISRSCSTHLTTKNVKLNEFLISIYKEILIFYEENEEELIGYSLRKKTLREIQISLERTGILETLLRLVNKYKIPAINELLPEIFDMFCKILKKGNFNSQEAFYNILTMKNQFEPVFSYMKELITEKISFILSGKSTIIREKKKKISFENRIFLKDVDMKQDSKILQFLQLLCENHNKKLQLFLHNQVNFRKSYDLVSHAQHYLTILFNHFEPFLFVPLIKCFDLLIEFIQGPCLENQLTLINSKLLITINDILKYYLNSESEVLQTIFPLVNALKKDEIDKTKNTTEEGQEELFENNFNKMSTFQISLLTFKSSILLLALIENRTKEDSIYKNIKNIIKPDVLRKVCIKIYFEHLSIICETNNLNDYELKLHDFNKAEEVQENAIENIYNYNSIVEREPTEVSDYLILETGFFLYFLILYYEDYEQNLLSKPNIVVEQTNLFERGLNYFKGSVFGSIINFIIDFPIAVLTTLSYIVAYIVFVFSLGRVKIFNLLRRLFRRKIYVDEDSLPFYEKYTQSIEILREEKVYKIYFYLLPFFFRLNKFEKVRFLEEIDRTNSKTKLMDILKFTNKLKYELVNDYYVKEFTGHLPILGLIFRSVELWKDLSLLLTIVQNIFNIFAVRKVGKIYTLCLTPENCVQVESWVDEKTLFNINPEDFSKMLEKLFVIQCTLSCLIFVEFISKKILAIYSLTEEEVNALNVSNIYRKFLFIKNFLKRLIFNFEVIYYFAYVVFAFLGTFESDFFFAFLLLEIVQRFKTLRNVLSAIKNPYKELVLTFILWIILIYYFAIFAYAFFRDDFPYEQDCNSLIRCVAVIFYENNRMDNGISGYLRKRQEIVFGHNPFTGRFWYDELFNLILKILIIQMISGIIIDNFAVLREEEVEMISDMKNICTICSLKREAIVKIYNKYGMEYTDHIIRDHHIFNYIFYIIYLFKKDKTEFTGIESYLYELAFNQKDITWFPIDQLYIAKPGELQLDDDEDDDDDDD